MSLSVEERFDSFVEPEPMSGCFLWTGALSRDGYGGFRAGKMLSAHRFAYERVHGPLPKGAYVLHSCDTTFCVSPFHLHAGTQAQNLADAVRRGRNFWAKKSSCPKGHPYDSENTYIPPNEPHHRQCRACTSARLKRKKVA